MIGTLRRLRDRLDVAIEILAELEPALAAWRAHGGAEDGREALAGPSRAGRARLVAWRADAHGWYRPPGRVGRGGGYDLCLRTAPRRLSGLLRLLTGHPGGAGGARPGPKRSSGRGSANGVAGPMRRSGRWPEPRSPPRPLRARRRRGPVLPWPGTAPRHLTRLPARVTCPRKAPAPGRAWLRPMPTRSGSIAGPAASRRGSPQRWPCPSCEQRRAGAARLHADARALLSE
jgi:hypothetical protein